MKKGCLAIVVLFLAAVIIFGVIGVMVGDNSPEPTNTLTHVPLDRPNSNTPKKPKPESRPATPEPATPEPATPEPATPEPATPEPVNQEIKYFSDEPKKAQKDSLTIGDLKMEGISQVTLKEGDTPAPFLRIIHSSGVKNARPHEVPQAFAALWEITDTDVAALIDEIKRRQDVKIEAAVKRNEAIQAAIIAEAGPKPKNSGWDGSVSCVKDYIKSAVHDPKSLEFLNWFEPILVKTDTGHVWRVKVVYRAKNGFGATVKEIGYAMVRHGKVVNYQTD